MSSGVTFKKHVIHSELKDQLDTAIKSMVPQFKFTSYSVDNFGNKYISICAGEGKGRNKGSFVLKESSGAIELSWKEGEVPATPRGLMTTVTMVFDGFRDGPKKIVLS